MPPTLKHKGSSRKNPVYRRMFRNAFRSFMILHVSLWVYCLITTWVNYAGWIQSINCPFPNYMVKISDFILYTHSEIYLSYLTIPILWSAFMPFVLWMTWMNYRWLDLPAKKRSSECWAWFMSLAKARHFELTAVTLFLMVCEIALIFAGLFSNKMIHFPPLGQGVFATKNITSTENLVPLTGVIAQYRIGPRLDEIIASSSFAGNTEMQLPAGPWIISSYWRMTQSCELAIEAAIPSFSKGVRWSSMAAIMMLLGVTLAFDIARLVASRAAGTEGELDDEVKDYCLGGPCGGKDDDNYKEEDDEGCMRELCGVDDDDNACGACCDDKGSQSGSDTESDSESESEGESTDDGDDIEKKESMSSQGSAKVVEDVEVVVDGAGEDKEARRGKSRSRSKSPSHERDDDSDEPKRSKSKRLSKSSRSLRSVTDEGRGKSASKYDKKSSSRRSLRE